MKVVLSQTIFDNLADFHGTYSHFLIADLDSGGWPQTGRRKAIEAMRKGFALHVAGDQHLASVSQYGTKDFRDSNFAFCVPSISVVYPRWWEPDRENPPRPYQNRIKGMPNTGDYLDGFKNKVTVYAIYNPPKNNRKGLLLRSHDQTAGYGMVLINHQQRTYTLECYKLLTDAANPKPDDQPQGWPFTVHQMDNFPRKAAALLPKLQISGITDPVVQVINEKNGETLYTIRIKGQTFQPKVFADGSYTVIVSDPDNKRRRLMLVRTKPDADKTIKVQL